MSNKATIWLDKGRDYSLRKFHPWVFSGAIKRIDGNPVEGDYVRVLSDTGEFLGSGHYGTKSIAVRVLSFLDQSEEEAVRYSIQQAVNLRNRFGFFDEATTTGFRLIHAEGDCLSGLVADYYNKALVLQFHSEGMKRIKDFILSEFKDVLSDMLTCVFEKNLEESGGEYLFGEPTDGLFRENGKTFFVDWENGQKTGFFLDQRENRALLERYTKNQTVLNAFCYTGGFSVYALSGGATSVVSVDASKEALSVCEKNISLNSFSGLHKVVQADCMQFLKTVANEFSVIVIDPPAFVKHKGALKNGLRGYEALNLQAIQAVRPGGIVFTFSCSQFVDEKLFFEVVSKAAQLANRPVSILHSLRQAPCHPINMFHPEGVYLKGLVLYVE